MDACYHLYQYQLNATIGVKSEAKVLPSGIAANFILSYRLWLWVSWVSYSYQDVYTYLPGISRYHCINFNYELTSIRADLSKIQKYFQVYMNYKITRILKKW